MNELRKVKIKYVTGNLIPIDRDNYNDYHSNNKKSLKTKSVKKNIKKSDREDFKDALDKYITAKTELVKVGKCSLNYKDKYDRLSGYMFCYTLYDIRYNYFKLSKKVRKSYKLSGYKIKKIDSDIVIFNLVKNYIDFITNKHSNSTVDSLFDIYATYNYSIKDINYDYLSDFHINIKGDINKLRHKFGIKTHLRSPEYFNEKIGSERKKIFELAFKLVTVSGEITCDMPRKKYLELCCSKEEFIEMYKILGGGIRHYMKFYEVSPLFKIFVKGVYKSDILNRMGYKKYYLDVDTCLGISAILFAQIILGTHGTKKGIKAMLESQSEQSNQLSSLFQLPMGI